MDYEDFLSEIYRPLKGIEILTDVIYDKSNNDWEFLCQNTKREHFDELIALNYLIYLCVKNLLEIRQEQLNTILD